MSEDQDIRGRAERRIGSVLHGKYRLDAILGVGGMAVVYSATHRNQKKLAVKVLHPELSLRAEVRNRFLREGYAANAVEHEGVAAILDDDVDESGSAFLVMELLQGLDVQAWRARSGGRLSPQVALSVAHQLLGVLAAAHAKGVIHRDIKPANLFMTASGRLKVLDFGIARVRERALHSDATRTGALLGTPAFMAPELASAQGDEIDARTDLWAVGATLFCLISGEHVHPGEHANQVLIRAATSEARSIASVFPELPLPVIELLGRALAFEKAARFQSAVDMAAAVKLVHEQLYGPFDAELVQALLAEAAALAVPAAGAPLAALAGAGPTVSERGVSSVAAVEPLQRLRSSVEPIFLPRSQRARPRRVASLLGVAACLLCAGLAFDWYASHAANVTRAPKEVPRQLAAAFPSNAPEVSLRAALPASFEPPLPSPLVPAPANLAPTPVSPSPALRPGPTRRLAVKRVSAAGSAPVLAPTHAPKNPLDVELQ